MQGTTACWTSGLGLGLLLGPWACDSRDFADGQFLCDPLATDPCPPGQVCVANVCRRPPVTGQGGGAGATGGSGGQGGEAGQGGTAGGGGSGGGGGPPTPPSCLGLAANCGLEPPFDCCAGELVPGGTFNRSNNASYPATVDSFVLDRFEVTVGRFRTFVAAGQGTGANPPAPGAGAHPKIGNSGWQSAWDSQLPVDTASLEAGLQPHTECTWTPTAGGQETLPINCVTWTMAFAFCAWDEGRLPTEAEWNYAAAGGSDQRKYPWEEDVLNGDYASFDCNGDGLTSCTMADILAVGSRPAGKAKWGHLDLAGNMWERVLDIYVDPYETPCLNCANLSGGTERVYRGGGFLSEAPTSMETRIRYDLDPSSDSVDVGFRCARPVP